MWLPSACPATVILTGDPGGIALPDHNLALHPQAIASYSPGDGRHLVLDTDDGIHRIWIRTPPIMERTAIMILPDEWASLRIASADRFVHCLIHTAGSAKAGWFCPTHAQQSRLSLLLAILDTLTDAHPTPSSRRIAERMVYRNTAFANAAEWKASSQRRQTQRLIKLAIAIRDGGYRQLLTGRIPNP